MVALRSLAAYVEGLLIELIDYLWFEICDEEEPWR